MDVESPFSAVSEEKSGKEVSVTVWQAEVALRLSKCVVKNQTSPSLHNLLKQVS